MKEIHDRMPVILDREVERRWVENTSQDDLVEMMKPYKDSVLMAYPISTKVNSPRNDTPDILEPVGDSIS